MFNMGSLLFFRLHVYLTRNVLLREPSTSSKQNHLCPSSPPFSTHWVPPCAWQCRRSWECSNDRDPASQGFIQPRVGDGQVNKSTLQALWQVNLRAVTLPLVPVLGIYLMRVSLYFVFFVLEWLNLTTPVNCRHKTEYTVGAEEHVPAWYLTSRHTFKRRMDCSAYSNRSCQFRKIEKRWCPAAGAHHDLLRIGVVLRLSELLLTVHFWMGEMWQ